MEKNNIISGWLAKYGDPEIEKKVQEHLDKLTKERVDQIINEVYDKYRTKYVGYEDVPSKDLFIFEIKNNPEFSEKWGLKIEERELSREERYVWYKANTHLIPQHFRNQAKEFEDKYVPTKLITLTYNNETIDVYDNR